MDGNIEGTITLDWKAVSPSVQTQRSVADVSVRDIVIFGSLKDNIHATGRVDLRQSAQVNGDILANRLSIEESAALKGRVELAAPDNSHVVCSPPVEDAPHRNGSARLRPERESNYAKSLQRR